MQQKVFLYTSMNSGMKKFLYYICVWETLIHIVPTQICDICFCVQSTSLVFLDAAFYADVAFHSPEGRDDSSSCYITSLSITTCDLKCNVNFVVSA